MRRGAHDAGRAAHARAAAGAGRGAAGGAAGCAAAGGDQGIGLGSSHQFNPACEQPRCASVPLSTAQVQQHAAGCALFWCLCPGWSGQHAQARCSLPPPPFLRFQKAARFLPTTYASRPVPKFIEFIVSSGTFLGSWFHSLVPLATQQQQQQQAAQQQAQQAQQVSGDLYLPSLGFSAWRTPHCR